MSLASALLAAARDVSKRFSPAVAGRFAMTAMLTMALAGCFQPMYGDHNAAGGPGVRGKLAAGNGPPIAGPNGWPIARMGVEVRNILSFKMTGTGGNAAGGVPSSSTEYSPPSGPAPRWGRAIPVVWGSSLKGRVSRPCRPVNR